jgi:uncharacterized phosphosugar-binding protein
VPILKNRPEFNLSHPHPRGVPARLAAVIADYLDLCRGLVDTVAAQEDAIAEAAALFSETILAGRMVHLFGSGHSRILVEEMWPRYGSFPGFNPIVELSLSFHNLVVGANGQRQAMFLENVHGLAARILRNYDITAQDTALIASSSGCNLVPIEMAEEFKRRGVKVVAIISGLHSQASRSQRRDGRKLQDFADIVLDTGAPVGDAMIEVPGLETPVGPGSTIGGCLLINAIKVEVAALLTEGGQPPTVLTAPALVGQERSTDLFERAYDEHARRLAKLYATIGQNPVEIRPEGRSEGRGGRSDRSGRGPRPSRDGDREPSRRGSEEREPRADRGDRAPREDRGERRPTEDRGPVERPTERPARGDRGDRPERSERVEPRAEPRAERTERTEREPRERREERPARDEARPRGGDRPSRQGSDDPQARSERVEPRIERAEPTPAWEAEQGNADERETEVRPVEAQKPANWATMDDIERRLWIRQNGDPETGGGNGGNGGNGGGSGHSGGGRSESPRDGGGNDGGRRRGRRGGRERRR